MGKSPVPALVIAHGRDELSDRDPMGKMQVQFAFRRAGVWVHVPMWFFMLVSGGLAIAPWIFRRYSLRTLLVAMTLVGVCLGAIVWVDK
jgi:hypothetical protein